jgi:hypothetical protein
MRKLVGSALALGLLSVAGIGYANAQVISDPTTIRSCLCEQQYVMALQDAVSARRQTLDQSQRTQTSLNNQVATRRAAINVYDSAELDSFKQLLQQRDDSVTAAASAADDYDHVANAYNDAVAGYNGTCAGHSYDQAVLQQAQATLACPSPRAIP